MSSATVFGSVGITPVNPDRSFDNMMGADGLGNGVTSGASSNTKTTTWNNVGGPTTAACYGLDVFISPDLRTGGTNVSSSRLLIDISFDGGGTINIPNIPIHIGNNAFVLLEDLPFALPSGAQIAVKVQGNTAGMKVMVGFKAYHRISSDPPGFTSAVAVNAADTTNTLAGTGAGGDVSIAQNPGGTSYVAISNDTGSTDLGALMVFVTETTSSPVSGEIVGCVLSLIAGITSGTSGDVDIGHAPVVTTASTVGAPRGRFALIPKKVVAHSTLRGRCTSANVVATDGALRFGVLGLVA